MRKVILYIAMSLDGYIAHSDDDISFLDRVAVPGEDYGYGDFVAGIDTVIVGHRTCEKVVSMGYPFPHADKQTYVYTRRPQPDMGNVRFYAGDLGELVRHLRTQPGKSIFVDGGAEVVHQLMLQDCIDEWYIAVIPVMLGEGIPLFRSGRPEKVLRLAGHRAFVSGLVQLHYVR